MRHIDRLPEPQILSKKKEEWQCKFEQKLAGNPKVRPDASKYGHEDIRKLLNVCSFNKCFYCESYLVGANQEIDHYIEVAIEPSLAFEWTNLYLSCSNCNDKLDHNSIPVTNVLNPCVDTDEEIKNHITFEKELICSQKTSEKGLKTIQKFRLSSQVLDLKRSKWLTKLTTKAIDIMNKMHEEHRTTYTQEEKDVICRFMQKDQPYSLMCEVFIRKNLAWAIN